MANVELLPMTSEEYEAWLPRTIGAYAAENVRTGRWSQEEALERSRAEHERLLPQGVATAGHRLCNIVPAGGGEPVGMLWFQATQKPAPSAFVHNIEIFPQFRRQGYAEQAMLALEKEARRLGLETIGLHVFGHNTAARPLYEKLGFVPTSIQMQKRLT